MTRHAKEMGPNQAQVKNTAPTHPLPLPPTTTRMPPPPTTHHHDHATTTTTTDGPNQAQVKNTVGVDVRVEENLALALHGASWQT